MKKLSLRVGTHEIAYSHFTGQGEILTPTLRVSEVQGQSPESYAEDPKAYLRQLRRTVTTARRPRRDRSPRHS